MHSWLYERVLNRHSFVQHTAAFNSLYDNTGVVGVFTTTDSSHAEDAINIITKELHVRRAKSTLPSSFVGVSKGVVEHKPTRHHRSMSTR